MKSRTDGDRRPGVRPSRRPAAAPAPDEAAIPQVVEWWIRSWSADAPAVRIWCGISRAREGFVVAVFDEEACVTSERFESLWEAQRAAMRLKSRYAPEPRPRQAGSPAP